MSVSSGPPAIAARGLRRTYNVKPNKVVALDGVDLEVPPGEFFGLLGPNGAGKTTLIKILTTLLLPSEGTARIFGFDVVDDVKRIRRIMNMVAGGEQSGYGILTVREQLWMFSQFYGLARGEGWKRVDELIDAVGMGARLTQRLLAALEWVAGEVTRLSEAQRTVITLRDIEPHPRELGSERELEGVREILARGNGSDRQLRILGLMAKGLTNSQISKRVGFSESTVRQETMAIYRYFGVGGRREAVRLAGMRGMLDFMVVRTVHVKMAFGHADVPSW